jgi:putative glutamine amidotransferase
MARLPPLVAVSSDFRKIDSHHWHMAVSTYVNAVVDAAGALPLIVPSIGTRLDIPGLLAQVDGVLFTGSRSNVHPSEYGVEPAPEYEPYDVTRDATTLPLIRAAIDAGVPLLAICRGFQELNVALGGTLHTEIQTLPNRADHRSPVSDDNDVRYAVRHPVLIERAGCLGRIIPASEVTVNSLHRQGLAELSPRLTVEAVAPDGTIEAVSVTGAPGFTLGVQWHPEYWAVTDGPSQAIFAAFGTAVAEHAARRGGVVAPAAA